MSSLSWRWLAVTVFILSSALNYLDRSLLNVLAPLILKEFALDQKSYGFIISAFSIVYAFSSLGAGILLDRIGLNKSISAAVAWWSSVSIFTAFTTGFGSLLGVRAALGVGESAGVPAFGKLNGIYLKPSRTGTGDGFQSNRPERGRHCGRIGSAGCPVIWLAHPFRFLRPAGFAVGAVMAIHQQEDQANL